MWLGIFHFSDRYFRIFFSGGILIFCSALIMSSKYHSGVSVCPWWGRTVTTLGLPTLTELPSVISLKPTKLEILQRRSANFQGLISTLSIKEHFVFFTWHQLPVSGHRFVCWLNNPTQRAPIQHHTLIQIWMFTHQIHLLLLCVMTEMQLFVREGLCLYNTGSATPYFSCIFVQALAL